MGIKITTDDYGIRVWRSDKFGFPQYAVVTGKTESGKSEYQQVQFRHGIELENGAGIYIDNAFPTMRTWKDKNTGEEKAKSVWMITSFRYKTDDKPDIQLPVRPLATDLLDDLPDSFAAADDEIPF